MRQQVAVVASRCGKAVGFQQRGYDIQIERRLGDLGGSDNLADLLALDGRGAADRRQTATDVLFGLLASQRGQQDFGIPASRRRTLKPAGNQHWEPSVPRIVEGGLDALDTLVRRVA